MVIDLVADEQDGRVDGGRVGRPSERQVHRSRTGAAGRRHRIHRAGVQQCNLRRQSVAQHIADLGSVRLLLIHLMPCVAVIAERHAHEVRPEPGGIKLANGNKIAGVTGRLIHAVTD